MSQSARRYMLGGGAFIVLLLCGVAAASWNMRATTLKNAGRAINQLGVAITEQTTRSLQGVDNVLVDVAGRLVESFPEEGAAFDQAVASAEVNDWLKLRLRTLPQSDAISIADAKGHLVNLTRVYPPPPIDISGRDYFQAMLADGAVEMAIGTPIFSTINDAWVIVVSRRLRSAKGEFLGAVMSTMPVDYLEQFYQAVSAEPGTSVTLRRRDGVLLAQYPRDDATLGKAAPGSGTWEAAVRSGGGTMRPVPGPDGANGMVSVHVLPDYPLVLDVAMTEDAALSGWRRQTWAVAFFSLLAAGCMALMLRTISRQFAEQRSAALALSRRNAELAETAAALRGNQQRLAEQSATLKTTLENINQGLIMIDAAGHVGAYNRRALDMLSLPAALLDGRPSFEEVLRFKRAAGFGETPEAPANLLRLGEGRQPNVCERLLPGGRFLEVRSQDLPGGGMVRTYSDITERKAADAQIRQAAYFDPLTGLANRQALQHHLDALIGSAEAASGIALIYLDLDRFKLINDARGHELGDRLLLAVARRLQTLVREGDLIARTGGDEFAIVLAPMQQRAEAMALGARLVERLGESYIVNGLRLTASGSIGIAIYPEAGETAANLLRSADIAMYRAKDAGRGTLRVYEPAMAARQQDQFLLEQQLREALGSHDFKLAYQPIVQLESNAVVGYEALLRWTHRSRGVVQPQEFVASAEATGLIVPLGAWVLDTACQEAAAWRNECSIAVNLSPVQFRQGDVVAMVQNSLAKSGLSPGRLELEVTEGVLLEDSGAVLEVLTALRALGVSLTLDDFGTGFASLSYLRRFPFDKIKIDKSFVRNLGRDPQSDAIVEAILLLGRRLDLRVVAEGVEDESQLEILRRMRCPLVQGFLTGRPMSAELARAL